MPALTLSTLLTFQTPNPESHSNDQEEPLCENIFDVPRHELLESYERLRRAFWYGPASVSRSAKRSREPSGPGAPEVKRARLEEKTQPSLQQRQQTVVSSSLSPSSSLLCQQQQGQEQPSPQPQPVSQTQQAVARNPFISSVSPSLITLWPLKHDLIRQLRNNDGNVPVIEEIERICDASQKSHLAKYIEPFLPPSSPVRQHLQKWLL